MADRDGPLSAKDDDLSVLDDQRLNNQDILFSAKAKDSRTRNNFDSTQRTKNSTQPTSAGILSPK